MISASSDDSDHTVDLEAQRDVPHPSGVGDAIHEKRVNELEQEDPINTGIPEIYQAAMNDSSSLPGGSADPEQEKRMIGDFDGSANALWTLYGKEAKSRDEAHVQTLKDDMDGVLIFAGLFSAALTAFVIDSKQNLKPNPSDQIVYYLQQNVAILDQISHQIAIIAPQVSIPSSPPPPFPSFKPLTSDIRINVFWFMALIFSLSAALLATLVQQWVRDYMHVYQRYSDPLKSARLRQYLHEGSEGWYMPVVAEAVPGLLHVSLFLFFVGLGDSVMNINTTVGIGTIVPMAMSGILYIFTIFAPIIYPQSPYQNSFSGPIWYMVKKLGRHRYRGRGSKGASKSVSSNMAEGQMQLAMEESEEREGRDERAIRWLIGNMTEDAEMESFVMAIPGSFNGGWGVEVWKKVSNPPYEENYRRGEPVTSPMSVDVRTSTPLDVGPSRVGTWWNVFDRIARQVNARTAGDSYTNTMVLPHTPHPAHLSLHSATAQMQGEDVMHELSGRVAHLLETCKNRGLFSSDELWRRRTRACIETTALLVCCTGAELGQFGDIAKLLGDIGSDQDMRTLSLVGKDQLFVMRWTCLSLVAIRTTLQSEDSLHIDARTALDLLGAPVNSQAGAGQTLTNIEKILETIDKASRCLDTLFNPLNQVENLTTDQARRILRANGSRISELKHIDIQIDNFKGIELSIRSVQDNINKMTHGKITRQLPGIKVDSLDTDPVIELVPDIPKSIFLFPGPVRDLKRICSLPRKAHDLLESGCTYTGMIQSMLTNLRQSLSESKQYQDLLRRQVWRLQGLSEGGGLGFTVELFFVSLRQLLSTSSSNKSHSALFVGTFRAITSDWRKYKHSIGTQKLLLNMVVLPDHGIIPAFDYPDYIVNEFLILLGNVLEGQSGAHIDDIVQQFSRDVLHIFVFSPRLHLLFVKVLDVLVRSRSSSSSSS